MRAIEFVADEPGDWAVHCHKSHHAMNAMGHKVKTWMGVDQKRVTPSIKKLAPGYMAMGERGMAEMGEMEMPLPDNTLPMMTGFAQFGAVEMGGMFSVLKVREGLSAGDYRDPGWFKHPEGTVARDVERDAPPEPASRAEPAGKKKPAAAFRAVKPRGHSGH